jgi:hypothetical protein
MKKLRKGPLKPPAPRDVTLRLTVTSTVERGLVLLAKRELLRAEFYRVARQVAPNQAGVHDRMALGEQELKSFLRDILLEKYTTKSVTRADVLEHAAANLHGIFDQFEHLTQEARVLIPKPERPDMLWWELSNLTSDGVLNAVKLLKRL